MPEGISSLPTEEATNESIETEFQRWRELMERQKRDAPFLERKFGGGTTETVARGKHDSETFENFSIRKHVFSDEKIIWICFPGIGGVEDGYDEKIAGPLPSISGLPAGLSGLPGGIPSKLDAVPRQGTAFIFHGPTSVAGYTPEQCIRSTEKVKEAVDEILNHHPEHKVRVFSFSAGTHLGFYVANQIGKERAPVDKFISLAPGNTMASGIYSTWVVEPLAQDLFERGITRDMYHEEIKPYTQQENLRYLPAGRNLVIHAGTEDTFIMMDAKDGTNELVGLLRTAGKHPTYVVHEGANHVSLPLSLILQQNIGRDPYRLYEPRSVWENPESFRDSELMNKVETSLAGRHTKEEMILMGHVLATRGGRQGLSVSNWNEKLSLPERATAEALMNLNICKFFTEGFSPEGPNHFGVVGGEGIEAEKEQLEAGERSLKDFTEFLETLDRDGGLLPAHEARPLEQTVNLLEEVGEMGFTPKQFVLLTDSEVMDVAASPGRVKVLVSKNELERLRNAHAWTEEKLRDGTTIYRKGHIGISTNYGSLSYEKASELAVDVNGVRVINLRSEAVEDMMRPVGDT